MCVWGGLSWWTRFNLPPVLLFPWLIHVRPIVLVFSISGCPMTCSRIGFDSRFALKINSQRLFSCRQSQVYRWLMMQFEKKPLLVFENFESLWGKPRLERLPWNSVEFCLEIKLVTQTTGKQSRGREDSVNSVDCCWYDSEFPQKKTSRCFLLVLLNARYHFFAG